MIPDEGADDRNRWPIRAVPPDLHAGTDHASCANLCALADSGTGSDNHAWTETRAGMNAGLRMYKVRLATD